MASSYSRREFYDLVWSKPITHIAKDFALSDVAIHKICRKHEILTPPPGYWAKRNAGKAAVQTKLTKASRTTSDSRRFPVPSCCPSAFSFSMLKMGRNEKDGFWPQELAKQSLTLNKRVAPFGLEPTFVPDAVDGRSQPLSDSRTCWYFSNKFNVQNSESLVLQ